MAFLTHHLSFLTHHLSFLTHFRIVLFYFCLQFQRVSKLGHGPLESTQISSKFSVWCYDGLFLIVSVPAGWHNNDLFRQNTAISPCGPFAGAGDFNLTRFFMMNCNRIDQTEHFQFRCMFWKEFCVRMQISEIVKHNDWNQTTKRKQKSINNLGTLAPSDIDRLFRLTC